MKIDFDEEKHEYSVGGVVVPSVSEILALLSAERYSQISPWTLQAAAERGKAVHRATQLIDYGFYPEDDFSINNYLLAYQSFLSEHDVEWRKVESIVSYSRGVDGELPIYAGTVDRYGMLDGKLAVVDLKTYATMSTDALLGASCQTRLYKDALEHSEFFGIDDPMIVRYVLHLRKDGTYRLINLDEFDVKRGFSSESVAWWCLYLNRELAEARKNRKRGKK